MTLDLSQLRALVEQLDITHVHELFGESWYICRADGSWFAVKRGGGMINWDGPASLIQDHIRAERLADFAGQLLLQELLSQLTEDELARVYGAAGIPDGQGTGRLGDARAGGIGEA